MELVKVGKVETDFDVHRSLSKAERFVFSKTRTGKLFYDCRTERALKDSRVHVISTESIAASEKGKYPIALYSEETRACHQGRQVWLKATPLITREYFEREAVHEFTHLADNPILGETRMALAIDSMTAKYVSAHPMRAFQRHFKKSDKPRGWRFLPELFSFMKSISSYSEAVFHDMAINTAISEGRARFMQLLYCLENGAEEEAGKLIEKAHFGTLSSIFSKLPFSPYEIGLSFMLNLERLIGAQAAMEKTLLSPPKAISEFLSPEDYLNKAEKE